MKYILSLFLSIWVSVAYASVEYWPALYDVNGVAADDALNIRSAPTVSSDVIGTLRPDQRNVEVVGLSDDNLWGLVNAGEGSGWVSMRFMHESAGQTDTPPSTVYCGGTEPFWGLDIEGEQGTLTLFGDTVSQYDDVRMISSSNRLDRAGFVANGLGAVILGQTCSDGMSDRTYGIAIELLTVIDGQQSMLSGCCSLSQP